MTELLTAVSIVLILIGITTLIIGIARHFFPMVDEYFPESFKKPLSIQYAAYYLLIGLVILLIIPRP